MARWSGYSEARFQAIVYMSLANALHFAGYEFARCAIMALFTSDQTGFTSTSMITLATGLGSPFSLALLWAHRRIFDRNGARRSLLLSTTVYALSVGSTGAVLRWCSWYTKNDDNHIYLKLISQCWIVYMFVAKGAFVQLLYSQHWSFLTSMLSSEDNVSKTVRWTPIISGIASIAATASGWMVSPLVDLLKQRRQPTSTYSVDTSIVVGTESAGAKDGLTGLLFVATVTLLLTAYCSDTAYRIAEEDHCAPSAKDKDDSAVAKPSSTERNDDARSMSLLQKSLELFRRVPVLGVLCAEVLLYQSVASFLSHLFVSSTKEFIPVDEDRAMYTGKVYAWINGGSGVLQFGVLPLFLGRMGGQTRYLWLVLPCFVLFSAAWMVWKMNGSAGLDGGTLVDVMTASFCVVKILEYSLRGVLTEMVYSSLDYESNYFGKEVVCLFFNRLGRSGSAVMLAIATATFSSFFSKAPFLLACSSAVWLVVSFRLIRLLQPPEEKVKVG